MSESKFNLLEFIRQQSIAVRQSTADVAVAEQKAAKAGEEIISTMVSRQENIGAQQKIVVQAAQTGNLLAQQQANDAVTAAGGYNLLYEQIAAVADRQKSLQTNLGKIRAANEANPGIGPFAAIARAVDSAEAKRAAKIDLTELQTLSAGTKEIVALVNSTGALARSNAQTITTASASASADIVEMEAAQQAAKLRLEGLKYNIVGVQAAAAADDKMLATATALGNFARAEASFQLSLEEEQRRREQFSWQKEQAAAAREEKLDEKGFEQRTIEYINLGEAARGLPPSSSQEIRDMIKPNKGLSQEYAELYQNGKIAARTGQALISNSTGKVAAILSQDPTLISALDEQQKKVAALILDALKVIGDKSVRAKEGLDDDKTGAKANRVITQAVQQSIQRQLAYVGNNPDNVFFLGEPSSYIGSKEAPGVSAFQKYTLTKRVFEPAINAGASLSDVSVPYKLTLEAIKRGELSSSQAAADFSNIYKRMSALHRAGADFKKFAIALPPDGAQYRVKIEGEVIDVTDFVAVAQAMNRSLARSAFSDYRKGLRINPGLEKELKRNTQGFPDE